MKLFRLLGSLWFAVSLIAALAVILIVSTTLESLHGTPFVQRFFYQSGWFDVFLSLVGVNILFSSLSRYPFKRRHTGFLVTHLGILILLIGSLMTRLMGVEGQILLEEGDTSDRLSQNSYQVMFHSHNGQTDFADLGIDPGKLAGGYHKTYGTTTLTLERIWDHAAKSRFFAEGEAADPANAAVEISLKSGNLGMAQTFWLVEKDAENPHASVFEMGPARISLEPESHKPRTGDGQNTAPSLNTFEIHVDGLAEPHTVSLENIPSGDIPLGETGWLLRDFHYYPDARVDNNKLVSVTQEPMNPAVEFTLVNPEGQSERHTFFAMFPDFETIHGHASDKSFKLKLAIHTAQTLAQSSLPSFTVYHGPSGWSYRTGSKDSYTEGALTEGQAVGTGWMDIEITAVKLLNRAVAKITVTNDNPSEALAVEISKSESGKEVERRWILAGDHDVFTTSQGEIIVALGKKNLPVPFKLKLKDFRKVDYPGTNRPASFESDVALMDDSQNLEIHRTIKMNEPLDYKGYRIFQSSYIQDPSGFEASIFTVAKNPGITLIYSGSVILFVGIFILFYIKPLSSFDSKDTP